MASKRQTLIANLIDKTDTRAQYDEEAKRLLALSEILAWILHSCVDEFKAFDIPFIMKNCFVGKPIISVKAVYTDMSDMSYIQAMNFEASKISELRTWQSCQQYNACNWYEKVVLS